MHASDLAGEFTILCPIRTGRVSQGFGEPATADLKKKYRGYGLINSKGEGFHNGIDYAAAKGTPTYASVDGKVIRVGYNSPSAGHYVRYRSNVIMAHGKEIMLEFRHLHSHEIKVALGQKIEAGDIVTTVNNSGFSSGNHLHYDCRLYVRDDLNTGFHLAGNGFMGYIDPTSLYLENNVEILPVDRYYGRERNWAGWVLEYTFRFAKSPVGVAMNPFLRARVEAARYVHKTLKARGRRDPILTNRESNAIIYGAWDLDSVLDPAMFAIWAIYTKKEYTDAIKRGIPLGSPLIMGGGGKTPKK